MEWPGSRGPAGYIIKEVPGIIKSKTCLLPMVRGETYDLIDLHKHYRNNILPLSGGLLDQPNAYKQAMELLSSAWSQKQK